MFENGSKMFHYYVYLCDKNTWKMPKIVIWKSEAWGKTVLPDMSILIGQKFMKNDKNRVFKPWKFRSNSVTI